MLTQNRNFLFRQRQDSLKPIEFRANCFVFAVRRFPSLDNFRDLTPSLEKRWSLLALALKVAGFQAPLCGWF
jgi:hypothetical protein